MRFNIKSYVTKKSVHILLLILLITIFIIALLELIKFHKRYKNKINNKLNVKKNGIEIEVKKIDTNLEKLEKTLEQKVLIDQDYIDNAQFKEIVLYIYMIEEI